MNIETVSLIEPNLITAQSISETEQQPPSFFFSCHFGSRAYR